MHTYIDTYINSQVNYKSMFNNIIFGKEVNWAGEERTIEHISIGLDISYKW